MIILQANKIERSFAGEVLFDNISLQVDERDRIALVGKNGAGKSTLLKILVGEEEPTSGEINKKRDLSLSYLAQDSRFESSNTIYDEMLHVFDDLRKTEKSLRQMELEMGEKTGADLDKLMQDYDRLSEEFRQAGERQGRALPTAPAALTGSTNRGHPGPPVSAKGSYPQPSEPRSGRLPPNPGLSTGCRDARSFSPTRPLRLSPMGEWTTAELRGQGLSKDAIRRKVREGKLFRVHRGIYTDEWMRLSPCASARATAQGVDPKV